MHRCNRETIRAVTAGLVAGARYVACDAAGVLRVGRDRIYRFCYGIITITTLLLYRNYLPDDGFFRSGLAGLAQIVLGVAVGSALAAIVTPPITRRLGFVRWASILLMTASSAAVGLILPYRLPLLVLAACVLGFTSQGIKICVDTLLQQNVADDFRGRVFTLYDTLFNVTFVAAAAITAVLIPDSGHSPAAVVAISVVYAVVAIGYLRFHGRGQLAPVGLPCRYRSRFRSANDDRPVPVESQSLGLAAAHSRRAATARSCPRGRARVAGPGGTGRPARRVVPAGCPAPAMISCPSRSGRIASSSSRSRNASIRASSAS